MDPGAGQGYRTQNGSQVIVNEFRTSDYDSYRMDYKQWTLPLEPEEDETRVVGEALNALVRQAILPHANYHNEPFLRFRQAVVDLFDIPWTAITPRMQRLIWAINAIKQPKVMVAAGVFCGNTFISNAGAAVGPGAVYVAEDLVGIEIKPDEAERAERNVRRIDPTGVARVVAADAVDFLAEFEQPVELLYLDADGDAARGKSIYLDILKACYDRMPPGSVVLAHNSINCAERLEPYLRFVRDPATMTASVNVMLDPEGLEVSVR